MSSSQGKIPALQLSPQAYRRSQQCVHCGLCLPACPTYTENGLEADSPRGRIYLMKSMADGKIEPSDSVRKHLDLCLDCRACETACPSGVVYHELIEETRSKLKHLDKPSRDAKLVEWICLHIMTHPTRLKLALLPARLAQRMGLWGVLQRIASRRMGPQLAKMQQMLPPKGPIWPRRLPEHPQLKRSVERPEPSITQKKKIVVGFLPGCVGSVMFNDVNRKAIDLLQHFGCEVVVPRDQTCCGAIHHHAGYGEQAAQRAMQNIKAFERCDFVVNTIAGCGAMLKEYGHLLQSHAADAHPKWADRGQQFDAKVRDICELLYELQLPEPKYPVELRVTYHDACHLAHAQKITAQPRKLLERISGLQMIPLRECDMCCGAAGTYNLMQPEMAQDLGKRKAMHIRDTGAEACVTGNVGCAMQIASESQRTGHPVQVYHPVEILHRAYLGQ